MIRIKTPQEISTIIEGGKIIGTLLQELIARAQPGVTTRELDQYAEEQILAAGGVPSFKHYRSYESDPAFPSTICASVNDQLVHTPASDYVLKAGDVLKIDIGMKYPNTKEGMYTDTARTLIVGGASTPELDHLLTITQQSLDAGIAKARAGNSVADIAKAIEGHIVPHNYGIIRQLVGHGVGHAVHEEPHVPNFYSSTTPKVTLKPGMVLAIEPMVSLGGHAIETGDDGWAITMSDGSLCAHFEDTVIITDSKPIIATRV